MYTCVRMPGKELEDATESLLEAEAVRRRAREHRDDALFRCVHGPPHARVVGVAREAGLTTEGVRQAIDRAQRRARRSRDYGFQALARDTFTARRLKLGNFARLTGLTVLEVDALLRGRLQLEGVRQKAVFAGMALAEHGPLDEEWGETAPRCVLLCRRDGELRRLADEDGVVWVFIDPSLAGRVAERVSERLGWEEVLPVPAWRGALPQRVRTAEDLPAGEMVELIEELPARLARAAGGGGPL